MMAARIWPSFMVEPEYQRELDDQEWERVAQEWEDKDYRDGRGIREVPGDG